MLTPGYRGGWIRGDASDYDAWAKLVGDSKWSYKGLLPYFRKTEHYHTYDLDVNEHGYEGPVRTQSVSSTGRDYPLRDQIKAAWESAGVVQKADANSGFPQGLGELIENRDDGKRQLASTVYSLAGVKVMTETLVKSILVEKRGTTNVAIGVQLADNQTYRANKEVLLSAGAYRTPQVLLLSGIGPAKDLAAHGITQIVDAPYVGQNLHDHMAVAQWWKLRDPEAGLSLGSPKFNNPAFAKGTPMDWVITQTVPHDGLKQALAQDEGKIEDSHPLLTPARSCTESFVVYVGANAAAPTVPMDGSHVTTTVIGLLPTSRGSVTLASSDSAAAPRIDPNYYATEADRYVMRTGLKKMIEVMLDTKQGKELVEGETVAEGQTPLNAKSPDSELDKLIKERGK